MANEYQNLQKHINDRALNILQQAKAFEDNNKNRILSGIVEGALKEIDTVSLGINSNITSCSN